jgi:hypothetical protein
MLINTINRDQQRAEQDLQDVTRHLYNAGHERDGMKGRSYLSRRAAVDCRKQGEPFRLLVDGLILTLARTGCTIIGHSVEI